MSLETARSVWQARTDPRRRTASIGMYTHVRDRWGIFYDQPILLNERQAGAAIEGVTRQNGGEDVTQLAVDTHGYTDFAMSLSRLLGFDLCPRLSHLRDRRLHVPRGNVIPSELAAVADADVRLVLIARCVAGGGFVGIDPTVQCRNGLEQAAHAARAGGDRSYRRRIHACRGSAPDCANSSGRHQFAWYFRFPDCTLRAPAAAECDEYAELTVDVAYSMTQ